MIVTITLPDGVVLTLTCPDGSSVSTDGSGTPVPPDPNPEPVPPNPPASGWEMTWPFQEIAPAPMQTGKTYACTFIPTSDPQGHSISIAEFGAPPRMRTIKMAYDASGTQLVDPTWGIQHGISGMFVFGTDLGQIKLTQGVRYFFVVVNDDATPEGDATAVVVLR